MTTPGAGAVAPYSGGNSPASTVSPTAVASGKSSAVFALGELLKTIVHKTLTFPAESGVDSAVNTIDAWVRSFVSPSEVSALATGDERAAKEDVSLRVPPGGGVATQVVSGPVLDYQKLAQAILAEQQKLTQGEASS